MNRLLFAVLVLSLLAAPLALGATQVTPQVAPPKIASAESSKAGQQNTVADTTRWNPRTAAEGMKVIWPYLIVVLAIAVLPRIVDILAGYISSALALKRLTSLANNDKLDKEELQRLMETAVEPPKGIPGLARTSIALAVVGVIGIAVFHVLVFYQKPSGDTPQVLTNVLSILGGLVAAVTGFYFGGKASTEGAAKKEQKPVGGTAAQSSGTVTTPQNPNPVSGTSTTQT